MKFTIEPIKDKVFIRLHKEIGAELDAVNLENSIVDLIYSGNKMIVIDLSELNFITSRGIGAIIYAHTTCNNKGVSLSVVGVNGRIFKIFKKMKIDKIIHIKEK